METAHMTLGQNFSHLTLVTWWQRSHLYDNRANSIQQVLKKHWHFLLTVIIMYDEVKYMMSECKLSLKCWWAKRNKPPGAGFLIPPSKDETAQSHHSSQSEHDRVETQPGKVNTNLLSVILPVGEIKIVFKMTPTVIQTLSKGTWNLGFTWSGRVAASCRSFWD